MLVSSLVSAFFVPLFPSSAVSKRGVSSLGHGPLLSGPHLAYGKYRAAAPHFGFSHGVNRREGWITLQM